MTNSNSLLVSAPLEVKLASEIGLISGYASTFGGEPDVYGDLIQQGAFSKSLTQHKSNGTAPVMLWSHNQAEVIGRWNSITEDAKGLQVEGQLDLNVTRAREALSLIKGKALSGLSIGFRTGPQGRKFNPDGTRTLLEIDLAEISLVALPANRGAKITDVKSVESLRDFERFLRDHGYSRVAAAKLAKSGWCGLDSLQDENSIITEMAASLKAASLQLKKG